jgi:hypothetical protein
MALFKPSESGIRDPLSNARENGRVVNPPRYSQVGKLDGPSKGVKKNSMTVTGPGNVTSVKKGR